MVVRRALVLVMLLGGCAAQSHSTGDQRDSASGQQPSASPPDVVQQSIDRREAGERRREQEARQDILDRAAAARLPDGVRDLGDAEANAYVGQYGAVFLEVAGEAEQGGLLVVLDSVAAPLGEKQMIAHLPEPVYLRLESGGRMGRLMRDRPVVLVRLVKPQQEQWPSLVSIEPLK